MGRTLTKSTKSVSCTLCSFEITWWSRELAKRIIGNHQQRKHTEDHHKHMGQETHMTLKDRSVQESHSRGARKKDNNQALFKLTDTTEGYVVLTSTFYLGRVEPTPEETKSRDQEDISTDNLGVLMDSVRKRMKVLIEYI